MHRKYIPFDIFPTSCNVTQFIYFWKTALHVSGGNSTHHQEHTQLYLKNLVLVKPLLLPVAIAGGSSLAVCTTMTKYKDRHGSETLHVKQKASNRQHSQWIRIAVHLSPGGKSRAEVLSCRFRSVGFRVTLDTCTDGTGSTDNFKCR